jgi:hypothetical protein
MTRKFIALCFLILPWLSALPVAAATPTFPVQVKTYGQHVGSRVTYHYQVVNNSPYEVASVIVGYGANRGSDPASNKPELVTIPPGWDEDVSGMFLPPGISTAPPGWEAKIYLMEETPTVALSWGVIDRYSQAVIQSGATIGGMSITLEAADSSYLNNHVRVGFSLGEKAIIVPTELLDTAPPSLSVSVSPATLWPPNEKFIPITVTLTVKDDYDPQPEIKLESITANEPLEKDDIKDAQIGTDDRQFKLKAEREGKNMTGRIYTVTYSAIDASGNKTTASATVTVPHDERKKDD